MIPGPWTIPAVLSLVAVTAAASAYTISRGSVKKAALAGAAAVAVAVVKTAPAPARITDDDPTDGGRLGAG